jgi:hypothetical protein
VNYIIKINYYILKWKKCHRNSHVSNHIDWKHVGFEVLTAVVMKTSISLDTMSCSLFKVNQCFGRTSWRVTQAWNQHKAASNQNLHYITEDRTPPTRKHFLSRHREPFIFQINLKNRVNKYEICNFIWKQQQWKWKSGDFNLLLTVSYLTMLFNCIDYVACCWITRQIRLMAGMDIQWSCHSLMEFSWKDTEKTMKIFFGYWPSWFRIQLGLLNMKHKW